MSHIVVVNIFIGGNIVFSHDILVPALDVNTVGRAKHETMREAQSSGIDLTADHVVALHGIFAL